MVTNVSKATVVTAFEGAILDALYCRRTKFAQQIRDGDAYLVCDLDISRFRCTKQKISSTKPFRLRQLGLSSGECLFPVTSIRGNLIRSISPSLQRMLILKADLPNYSLLQTSR